MGLRPGGISTGGTGLRPGGGGSGLRPGGASLGSGAGGGAGGSFGSGGAGGGAGAGGGGPNLQRVNPQRPGAPALPTEFVEIGHKDETGRMIYSKTDLMVYSALTERCVWASADGGRHGRGLVLLIHHIVYEGREQI